jgi:hypothetical protein
MRFPDTLPGWAKTLILLQPLIMVVLGLAIVLGGCVKHQEPNQRVEVPKIAAADSVSYGYPIVEAKVRRNLAEYDSLLVLKGARLGGAGSKYYVIGVYNRCGQCLLAAIEAIDQASNVAPPDYVGLAELARATVGPRYREFLSFTTMDYVGGKDSHGLAEMGAAYSRILERGFGQATRK